MFPDNMSLSLRFHSRILPVILVFLGLYCLLERSGVTCMRSDNGFSAEDASMFCEDQVKMKMMNEDDDDDNNMIRSSQVRPGKLMMERII